MVGRCPNCGQPTLFPHGVYLRINRQCHVCGLVFDRGEGFFLGPVVVNYAVTVTFFIVPVLVAFSLGRLGEKALVTLLGIGAIFLPMCLYHWSWCWWLTGYFCFLPNELPVNREDRRGDLDD